MVLALVNSSTLVSPLENVCGLNFRLRMRFLPRFLPLTFLLALWLAYHSLLYLRFLALLVLTLVVLCGLLLGLGYGKALEPEPHLVECLTKALYDMETVNDYCGIGEAGLYDTVH